MNGKRLSIATVALVSACTATAETVYKSIDAKGRVTYSSSPPADATREMLEEVPIAPGPTPQEQEAAAQRARELQGAANRVEQQGKVQATKDAKDTSEAEGELRKAEIALQEAQIQGDDDWQYLATGGRVLKQSYLDRVENAERRVEKAQKELRSVRSGRR